VGTVRRLAPPVGRDADDRDALRQVVEYYQHTLKQSPEVLQFLARAGPPPGGGRSGSDAASAVSPAASASRAM